MMTQLNPANSNRQDLTRLPIGVFLTFLLSPVFSVILALRNYKKAWSKNVLWAFIVFFGYTFVVTGFMDSTRYNQRLVEMSGQYLVTLQDVFGLMYQKDAGYFDAVEPLVTFCVSRFTDSSRVLFGVFGLIFGFFYSRNLWYLFSRVETKLRSEALPFLILAAMVIAIWQINGFRFWTAAHVFIYGLLLVHSGERTKGLMISTFSFLVHFSFVFAILIMWVHILVGNRLVWISLLYFGSFFLSEIDPKVVSSYASLVPEIFQERADKYASEEYREVVERASAANNWYVTLRHTSIRYAVNVILLFLLWRKRQYIRANKDVLSLFCFALILATSVNLVKSVPSVYRFQYVSDVILFSSLFILIQGFQQKVFPLVVKAPFILATALYVLVEIRIGFETTSILAVLGNPFLALFLTNEPSLITFFK